MVKRKSYNRNIEIEIRIPAPRENLGAFSVRIGFFPKEIRVYIDRFIQKSPERAKKSGHGDGQRNDCPPCTVFRIGSGVFLPPVFAQAPGFSEGTCSISGKGRIYSSRDTSDAQHSLM
jgi:hypothetical protein